MTAPGLLLAVAALGQPEPPPALAGVGLEQRLDARLPLEEVFVDERGVAGPLAARFHPGRPVLLNLAYYRCPMLCTLVLDGVARAAGQLDLRPGRDFDLLTLSIDPRESPADATARKRRVLETARRPALDPAWTFLTGAGPAIERVAASAGVRYRYLPEQDEYGHPAVTLVLTPDGRVSRYIPGLAPEPRTLRLALVEAAAGRIGSIVDEFLLYCFRFDDASGRYTPAAWRIMRLGAGISAVALLAALARLWLRQARARSAT